MQAKIKHKDGVYFSPVFAVSLMNYRSKAVVFDRSYTQLIVVDIYKDRYSLLFTDFNADDFCINEPAFKSYWDDRNIFTTVKRKRYSPQMLEDAKRILGQSTFAEFTAIKSEADLDGLALNSGSFHDGYVLGMTEKDGALEILLDTSWGSLIILRCKEIIENTLQIGVMIFYCSMSMADGNIELEFTPLSYPKEMILQAKHVEFRPLFEQRIALRNFEYGFANGHLVITLSGKQIEIDNTRSDVLDFGQRNVLGYLQSENHMHRCFIFGGETVYSLNEYITNDRKAKAATKKIDAFEEACRQKGLCFDKFLSELDLQSYERDYGELLYSHKYSKLYYLLFFLQFLPVLAIHNLFWLTAQLSNPQMKWSVYFIFGIGLSLIAALLGVAASLISFIRDKASGRHQPKRLEIYENGLKHYGYDFSFSTDYGGVTVEYNKRIIIHSYSSKHKLPKFKNDKAAYEIIKNQLSKKANE